MSDHVGLETLIDLRYGGTDDAAVRDHLAACR